MTIIPLKVSCDFAEENRNCFAKYFALVCFNIFIYRSYSWGAKVFSVRTLQQPFHLHFQWIVNVFCYVFFVIFDLASWRSSFSCSKKDGATKPRNQDHQVILLSCLALLSFLWLITSWSDLSLNNSSLLYTRHVEARGLMVICDLLRIEESGFEPWPRTLCCVLEKDT